MTVGDNENALTDLTRASGSPGYVWQEERTTDQSRPQKNVC